ncbi:MAG: DUF2798 domain-containing protein [Proteobacteria bacterium]|nr:DUF2798 domain-containing protein [Pseudomonadota bacterium]
MKHVQVQKSLETLLSTGIMAFIMSGAISAFRGGFSAEMLASWFSVFPVAWMFAIPAILTTRKLVSMIMQRLVKTIMQVCPTC